MLGPLIAALVGLVLLVHIEARLHRIDVRTRRIADVLDRYEQEERELAAADEAARAAAGEHLEERWPKEPRTFGTCGPARGD